MIEVIGPATVATFDHRVLELFTPDGSRRVHVSQLARAGIGSMGALRPGPTLEVHTTEGDHFTVPFEPEQTPELERLVLLLMGPAEARAQAY